MYCKKTIDVTKNNKNIQNSTDLFSIVKVFSEFIRGYSKSAFKRA